MLRNYTYLHTYLQKDLRCKLPVRVKIYFIVINTMKGIAILLWAAIQESKYNSTGVDFHCLTILSTQTNAEQPLSLTYRVKACDGITFSSFAQHYWSFSTPLTKQKYNLRGTRSCLAPSHPESTQPTCEESKMQRPKNSPWYSRKTYAGCPVEPAQCYGLGCCSIPMWYQALRLQSGSISFVHGFLRPSNGD